MESSYPEQDHPDSEVVYNSTSRGLSDLGYTGPKISWAKEQQLEVLRKHNKDSRRRQRLQELNDDGQDESEEAVRLKKKLQGDDLNRQIMARNHKDSVREMFNNLQFSKKPAQSSYASTWGQNNGEEAEQKDFSHHFRRDKFKDYSEAYIKHKTTMRK